MVCEKEPFMLIAGTVKITKLVVEWLWCLDDRLRISAHILGPGGSRVVSIAKKINAEPVRYFDVLAASEHGNDFYLVAKNIQRLDEEGKKSIIMDLEMFPYNAETEPNGPPGIPLKSQMRLETTDSECKCVYEDENAPLCEEVRSPWYAHRAHAAAVSNTRQQHQSDRPSVRWTVRARRHQCVCALVRFGLTDRPAVGAKCTEMKFPIPSQFQTGSNVCSSGLQVRKKQPSEFH